MGENVIPYILVAFAYMFAVYIFAQKHKDNSLVDIAWGPGFVLLALVALIVEHTIQSLITFIIISLWGVRLAIHIYKRHNGEDWRYRSWRREWNHPALDALFRVYLLQAILLLIIALPLIYQQLTVFFLFGILIWSYGFFWQVRADIELKIHKKRTSGLLTSGSWKLSRHPNYYGEALMWCGLWIASGVWWTGISFITITLVLWYVSIPLLEKRHVHKVGWQRYERNTPKLFPKKLW